MKKILTFSLLIILSFKISAQDEKIKGVCFVAAKHQITGKDILPIIEVNANWVALMPYAFIGKDSTITFNSKWQWHGEKAEGIQHTIVLVKAKGLKIMIKPHVWHRGAYTGDFKLDTDEEWKRFESSYTTYIMTFVDLAVLSNAEMFCIGTEWREFVAARPAYWSRLIKAIKVKYKGKLTYAANWDDYKKCPFWDELDFIGIDAYFPLSTSTNPKLNELIHGWEKQAYALKLYSEEHNKKIIFTEIGFRSIEGATVRPWEHHQDGKFDQDVQDIAYQAFFASIWKKDWLAGMFLWKWYAQHEEQGGEGDTDFTPQNKKAIKTITANWSH